MLKRLALVAVLVVAAATFTIPNASAATQGGYLPVRAGKAAIKNELSYYWIGSQTAMKVDLCLKPRYDKVSCYFQTREWSEGEWLHCYGVAVATGRFGWVAVKMPRGWVSRCYGSDSPAFVA